MDILKIYEEQLKRVREKFSDVVDNGIILLIAIEEFLRFVRGKLIK